MTAHLYPIEEWLIVFAGSTVRSRGW